MQVRANCYSLNSGQFLLLVVVDWISNCRNIGFTVSWLVSMFSSIFEKLKTVVCIGNMTHDLEFFAFSRMILSIPWGLDVDASFLCCRLCFLLTIDCW